MRYPRSAAALASLLVLAACGEGGGSDACELPPAVSAEATTYTGTSAGACSFPEGATLFAAVSPAVFDGSAACGTCLEVAGPAATAIVTVTDLCPGCATDDLDLSSGAWDAVTGAAPDGRVAVTWRRVACPVAGPVRFAVDEGANPFFALIVVRDHRFAIDAVDLRPAGATAWLPLARNGANGWTASSGGGAFATPLEVRATDVFGHTTATTLDALTPGAEVTAPQLEASCR